MASIKRCVFSGSTENLNTAMLVTLDGGKTVKVWVSDEYTSMATPDKVKEAYLASKSKPKKDREIAKLMERAKALGIELAPSAPLGVKFNGPKLPTTPAPAPAPTQTPGTLIIDGKLADKKAHVAVSGSVSAMGGASGVGQEYDIKSADEPSTDLKEGEQAEIGYVKGRGGMQVAIPVRRIGKTGETKVQIVNTGGDRALQDRFREMSRQEAPQSGYQVTTIQCGLCRSSGRVGGGKTCPKCNGAGMIDVEK